MNKLSTTNRPSTVRARLWNLSGKVLILMGLVLPVAPLRAQAPGSFFPWWDSPIVKDLNLSEDQTHQIQRIVREYRTKLIDQRAAVQRAEAELEDVYSEDSFELKKAHDAVERLVACRGELTRSLSVMGIRLRAVLTSEQYRELQRRRPAGRPQQRMMREFQRRNGPRGPGKNMPGPPPNQPQNQPPAPPQL